MTPPPITTEELIKLLKAAEDIMYCLRTSINHWDEFKELKQRVDDIRAKLPTQE